MLSFLEALDHRLFFLINSGLGRESLDRFFGDLSTFGGWTIVFVTLAALSADGRTALFRHISVMLLALLLFVPLNNTLKASFDRGRPARVFQEQLKHDPNFVRFPTIERSSKRSFPSGHSAFAFFCMHYLALFRRKARYWLWALAALAAIGRVYVGVHFPLDCLAGALLGIFGAWLAFMVYQRLFLSGQSPSLATSMINGSETSP